MASATRPHVLTPEAIEKLRSVTTAMLTSQLLKRGFRNTFISGHTPLRPDLRMVGYAFTLRYVPAREDVGFYVDYDNATNVQRLAVEGVGPEDVLVIDARSEGRAASFGHIIATRIMRRGTSGGEHSGDLSIERATPIRIRGLASSTPSEGETLMKVVGNARARRAGCESFGSSEGIGRSAREFGRRRGKA